MLTFELIDKKRRPIKNLAIFGVMFGIILLVIIGLIPDSMNDSIKTILIGIVAISFITSLFILSYSFKFKSIIGSISFSKEHIEVELMQRKEIIKIEDIKSIQLGLRGYEGINKSTTPHGLYDISYRSGINNFISIQTDIATRKFEFYIPDQPNLIELQRVVAQYKHVTIKKN